MAPQDDLTAERAAIRLLLNSLNGYDGACIVDIAQEKDIDLILQRDKQTRQEALREACRVLYARRDKLEKEWQDDETVPKGEHDEKDCDGACDLYCVQIIELGLAADELDRLASEYRGC